MGAPAMWSNCERAIILLSCDGSLHSANNAIPQGVQVKHWCGKSCGMCSDARSELDMTSTFDGLKAAVDLFKASNSQAARFSLNRRLIVMVTDGKGHPAA